MSGFKKDSLVLSHLDFITDSLINHGNNWWEYIVSPCTACDPRVTEQYRFILSEKNKKLQISYFGDYKYLLTLRQYDQWNPEWNERWEPDTSKEMGALKEKYGWVDWIRLDSNFFKGNYIINQVFLQNWANGSLQNDTKMDKKELKQKYILKFEPVQGIFYTKKEKLNGAYTIRSTVKGLETKKTFKNKVVYAIFTYPNTWIYMEDSWYFLDFRSLLPIEVLFQKCDKYSKQPELCK